MFLEISQTLEENTCVRVSLKRETLEQVFSRESCEISNGTFLTEHLMATASELIFSALRKPQYIRKYIKEDLIKVLFNLLNQKPLHLAFIK